MSIKVTLEQKISLVKLFGSFFIRVSFNFLIGMLINVSSQIVFDVGGKWILWYLKSSTDWESFWYSKIRKIDFEKSLKKY